MKRVALLLLVTLCFVMNSSAAPLDKVAQLDKLLTTWHDIGQLNGIVLVADHGKIIYNKGFGYANFEWKIPNSPQTRFRIGSVTKPFTTVLVLQQVQAGKVKLDAPITDYLPDYRKDTGSRVTVRHLLTHTSGIPTYIGKQMENWRGTFDKVSFEKTYCSGDLESEPGARWGYNNCGYFLLADIVERVTGKSYAQVLRENITGPLGMKDTGVDRNELVLENRASGYESSFLRGIIKPVYSDLGTAFGAGDIYSTAPDLFTFDQALYTDKLLNSEMRELMFKPTNDRYATGWFTHKAPKGHPAEGDTIQSHEGNIFGFFTNHTRIPERRALVVVIDNTHLDVFEEITEGVLQVLYKDTFTAPKRLAVSVIAPTILSKGVDAAISQYNELKRTQPDAYDYSGLSTLAWDLLASNRPLDAIAFFKLNIERNPNGWGSYYGIGEAHRQAGNRDLAIAAYEDVLRRFPGNAPSVQALRELKAQSPPPGN